MAESTIPVIEDTEFREMQRPQSKRGLSMVPPINNDVLTKELPKNINPGKSQRCIPTTQREFREPPPCFGNSESAKTIRKF